MVSWFWSVKLCLFLGKVYKQDGFWGEVGGLRPGAAPRQRDWTLGEDPAAAAGTQGPTSLQGRPALSRSKMPGEGTSCLAVVSY